MEVGRGRGMAVSACSASGQRSDSDFEAELGDGGEKLGTHSFKVNFTSLGLLEGISTEQSIRFSSSTLRSPTAEISSTLPELGGQRSASNSSSPVHLGLVEPPCLLGWGPIESEHVGIDVEVGVQPRVIGLGEMRRHH